MDIVRNVKVELGQTFDLPKGAQLIAVLPGRTDYTRKRGTSSNQPVDRTDTSTFIYFIVETVGAPATG